MAFIEKNLQCVATGTCLDQQMKIWTYKTTDTWATVAAAGYFADYVAKQQFGEHDQINIISSDEFHIARMRNVTNVATIVVGNWDMTV